jgi:apolipoprotein N-acyltransferase
VLLVRSWGRPSWSTVLRCVSAVVGGLLLWASFPPRPLWFLAPIGIAVIVLALRGRGLRAGFGYGYLAGLGFLVPLLPWVGVYVGAVPWLALAAAESVAVGLFGMAVTQLWRVPGAPLWMAGAWVATEGLRSRVPFHGFPWGRLAFGQSDGALLPLASLAGAPGLTFAVAVTGTCLAALVVHARARRRVLAGAAVAGVVAPLLLGLVLAPGVRATDSSATTATVALIQGNVPRLGLDFAAQREAVLTNHVNRTLQLADDVAAGREAKPDLVIWPENASDVDPLRTPDAAAAITRAARAIGVPILVGAVLRNVDGTTSNTVIVWDPVTGPGQQAVKRVLVPFGEYLPYRDFFRHFSSYADLAGNFVPGDGNGVVTLNGVPVAVATCYEVAFDSLVNESVRDGAQLITVPTNNATFGRTEMTYQQLAMSQVRAVEHGRAVVVAATSGVSAIVAPDGTVEQQTKIFTPAALVGRVPLRTSTTLATRLGAGPEIALSGLAVAALGAGLLRTRSSRETTESAESADEEDIHDGAGVRG